MIWIRQIQRGDTQHFHKLYHKHHQKLFTLCYRFTKNIQDAEEQLQEIFMRLLDKMDRFKEHSSFGTWAYRLAVNHLINFYNRSQAKGEETGTAEPETVEFSASDPDLPLILRAAIDRLPEGYRTVFILHDQQGYNHEEIARLIGCTAANSRSQLCRARMALRDQLKPYLAKEVPT